MRHETRQQLRDPVSSTFLFLLGSAIVLGQIAIPILEAMRGAVYVSYSNLAVGGAPLAMFFGLVLMISGAVGLQAMNQPGKNKWVLVLIIAPVVIALGCLLGMQMIMSYLCYS